MPRSRVRRAREPGAVTASYSAPSSFDRRRGRRSRDFTRPSAREPDRAAPARLVQAAGCAAKISFGRDRLVARRGFAWCVLRLAGERGVLAPSVEAAAVTGATVPSPLPDAAIAAPSSPISLRNGASPASPARAASDVIAASSASLGCAELVTVVAVVQSRAMRLPWLAARRQSSPAPFRGRDRAGGRGRARTGREARTRRTSARPPRQYVHRRAQPGGGLDEPRHADVLVTTTTTAHAHRVQQGRGG